MKTFKSEDYIKDGLSLGIFKSTDEGAFEAHTHEFTEIIYVLDGRATEVINGKSYEVSRGDLLFINYGSAHEFYSEKGGFTYINVCFAPEIMGKRIISRENAFDLLSLTAFDEIRDGRGEGVIHFSGDERRLIEAVLSDMLNEYGESLSERSAVLESYMNVLITKILRKMNPSATGSVKNEKMWRELSEYIGENLDKRLTLSALAKKCFYNPSYFSRVFKERFNITLAEYISRERAEYAAKLLLETSLSTDEIASRAGYGDKSCLYRAFSKIYGVTPSEYRQKK